MSEATPTLPSSCPFCLHVFSVATLEIHKHDPFVRRNCDINIEQQAVESDRSLQETDAGHSILEDLRQKGPTMYDKIPRNRI